MADSPASPTAETFQSKEYWLIIGLVAQDVPIVSVECKEDDKGQDYLLWTFNHSDLVRETEKSYNLGQPILIDLQKAKSAAEVFKRNLQYYRIR